MSVRLILKEVRSIIATVAYNILMNTNDKRSSSKFFFQNIFPVFRFHHNGFLHDLLIVFLILINKLLKYFGFLWHWLKTTGSSGKRVGNNHWGFNLATWLSQSVIISGIQVKNVNRWCCCELPVQYGYIFYRYKIILWYSFSQSLVRLWLWRIYLINLNSSDVNGVEL